MGVSIVVCTYNDSRFLTKALPSCLNQKVDKEIIIVDDCSSKPMDPEAQKIIDANKIRVIRHGKNQGLSAARNTGIAEASNAWVIPLDADDWFHPGGIKAL